MRGASIKEETKLYLDGKMAFNSGGTLEGSKCSRLFHNNSFSKKVHKRNCLLLFGQCALFTSKGLKCPWECENFKGAVL